MTEFLVLLVVCIISATGFIYVFINFSDASFIIKTKSLLIFIAGVLLLATAKYFKLDFLDFALYFIFYPIIFNSLNKLPLKKLVYYVLIIWMYGMILDFLSMLSVLLLQYVFTFDIYSYTSRIILTLIVFIILILIAKSETIKKFTNNIFKKVQAINYFDFALMSFVIFVFLVGVAIFFNLDNLSLSILLMSIIVLLSFSFTLLIRVRINLVENNIFLKLLKENNEFYLKIEDENRIFKHNLMAKLLSIKSVSGDKARKLIDDFLKSFNNNMDFSVHIKDMPYGLNGIIYEKIYPYIGKIHIKIDNKIDFDIFKKLKPRRYNVFVEKMIIALDNAVESCMTTTDKILIINLYFEDNNIIMDIKNTFSADLNVEDLGKINYSTKGKRHGLGLFSALRDNEVNMSMKIVNSLFITKIVAKQNMEEE